jgi:hypothetical protein
METFNELIEMYLNGANEVKSSTENLSLCKRKFFHIFTKKPISNSPSDIRKFYSLLKDADSKYSVLIKVPPNKLQPAYGVDGDIKLLSYRLDIVSNARDVFVSSLSGYEKEVSNIENVLNFRLTTTIAVFAIILSSTTLLGC